MTLRDILAGEESDALRASQAAVHGRSLTGLSGHRVETTFAARDELFGGTTDRQAEPLLGERVQPIAAAEIGSGSERGRVPDDPLFRRTGAPMRERVPFGNQEQTLAFIARPGYRPYWFSDVPGRISRAKRAGYSHVMDPDTSEPLSRITDRADGRGRASYLMEIPIQWYQEDMARQAAALGLRLDDIRKGQAGPGAGDNRYVPAQGIHITGR